MITFGGVMMRGKNVRDFQNATNVSFFELDAGCTVCENSLSYTFTICMFICIYYTSLKKIFK